MINPGSCKYQLFVCVFFSLLSSIPWYMCVTVPLAIHLSKDIWANFSFGILEAMLLQTSLYVDLAKGEQMHKVLKIRLGYYYYHPYG